MIVKEFVEHPEYNVERIANDVALVHLPRNSVKEYTGRKKRKKGKRKKGKVKKIRKESLQYLSTLQHIYVLSACQPGIRRTPH